MRTTWPEMQPTQVREANRYRLRPCSLALSTTELARGRQEEHRELQVGLGYIVSSKSA